jgi:hypothetical protein
MAPQYVMRKEVICGPCGHITTNSRIERIRLYKCLDEAIKNLARDGTLIVSVPKELAGDVLSSWLLSHGFELTSLNVLTNPHIKERRGRSGWICRPRS